MAPWGMFRFLVTIVLPDPAFGKGYDCDRARRGIKAAFRDAKPGDVVVIEDQWSDMLAKAIREPKSDGVNNAIREQLFPFQDALIEAGKERPAELKAV